MSHIHPWLYRKSGRYIVRYAAALPSRKSLSTANTSPVILNANRLIQRVFHKIGVEFIIHIEDNLKGRLFSEGHLAWPILNTVTNGKLCIITYSKGREILV